MRGGARRRHRQRTRPQPAARLAQGRRRQGGVPDPVERALPVRRRRRPRSRCGAVPEPAQLRRRRGAVGRPGDAPGRGQGLRLHHPARRHPLGDGAEPGAQRQQALPGRLAGAAGAACARRPVQRHDQQARCEQGPPRQHHGGQRRPGRGRRRGGAPSATPRASSRCSPSRTGATRSTGRSSRRSASARTGRIGPPTSRGSPSGTPTASPRCSTNPAAGSTRRSAHSCSACRTT